MRPPGSFKLSYRNRAALAPVSEPVADPLGLAIGGRAQKLVESLRNEILEGGGDLRIRQIFEAPREIYRIEIDLPEMSYARTTLLDADALEELLEYDDVRHIVAASLHR